MPQRNPRPMRVAFIGSMGGHAWGGSEVLWSEAALRLHAAGHPVTISLRGWPTPRPQVDRLRSAGIPVIERPWKDPSPPTRIVNALRARLTGSIGLAQRQFPTLQELLRFKPDLVVISQGAIGCGAEWMEWCLDAGIPYVVISQANGELLWPADDHAEWLARLHAGARLSCFVSQANRALFESMTGTRLSNAAVIWNPYQVRRDLTLPWPDSNAGWKFACVGRLDPSSKGQDLALLALAQPVWRSRPWSLSFVGSGPMRRSIERLAHTLGIGDRIHFTGQLPNVEQVWATHHALLLPSRYEGLPLAVIEAMLCQRPCIVTDVAGNREVIEDGITGFIAPATTADSLAHTLERAWEARERWADIGTRARINLASRMPEDPVDEFNRILLHCLTPAGNPSDASSGTAPT